jgi:GT2 family glycosyltransferase
VKARVLVVTYETAWAEADTLKALMALTSPGLDIELTIWDNSRASRLDPEVVEQLSRIFDSVKTVHTPENLALSKIYNAVAAEPGDYDVMVLLDQDTKLDDRYFQTLAAAAADAPAQVFLPVVRSGERIVSPGSYFLVKGKHWTEAKSGLRPSKDVVAISSGLAVRRAYLERWPKAFDERMNLYGIDTAFMLDYARREPSVFVLDHVLQHHTMLWSDPPKATMLFRFKNLRRARLLMHNRQPAHYVLALAYAGFSSLQLAKRYRDVAFLLP